MTISPRVAELEVALQAARSLSYRLAGYAAPAPQESAGPVLDAAARLASQVYAPASRQGDRDGVTFLDGSVVVTGAFHSAYRSYREAGWPGIGCPPEFGGDGSGTLLATAVGEMFSGANMALHLGSILTSAAVHALNKHGTPAQKASLLPELVAGNWFGTMNLTEPQAGSDVGAIRTQAMPCADGSYHLTGQKIFITWGDHDLTENVIHLVLARTPGAADGTRGLSLFVVPKFLIGPDGANGARNGIKCVSIEHKLGLHGTPTCTMILGEDEPCIGYLLDREHAGMRVMFAMMNRARLAAAMQGVGTAECAVRAAYRYASERIQSAGAGSRTPVAIIEHQDVKRMLMTMRAQTEAARALTYFCAAMIDVTEPGHAGEETGELAAVADLLTPLAKIYGSEIGVEVADRAIQVFGGAGYIEESGIAQLWRDVRITPIYEGTNGIQALDLLRRKLPHEGGVTASKLLWALARELEHPELIRLGVDSVALREALQELETLVRRLLNPKVSAASKEWHATPIARSMAEIVAGTCLALQLCGPSSDKIEPMPDAMRHDKAALANHYIATVVDAAVGQLRAADLSSEPALAGAL